MLKHGCPISREIISEVLARIVAGQVAIISLLTILYPHWYIPLLLVIDFFLRGFLGKSSLLKLLGMGIHKLCGSKGKKVNAGPKKFAMKIGFWITLIMLIFSIFNMTLALQITAGILIIASGMEAVFNFCLGYKVFPYWQMLKSKFQ